METVLQNVILITKVILNLFDNFKRLVKLMNKGLPTNS